jgi:hypothetical protein
VNFEKQTNEQKNFKRPYPISQIILPTTLLISTMAVYALIPRKKDFEIIAIVFGMCKLGEIITTQALTL